MNNPVKRVKRRGKTVLVIDFPFRDDTGRKQRYRHDASVQTMAGARAEAQRLMERAARTGSPVADTAMPTFNVFLVAHYRPLFMSRLRPGTAQRYEGILRQGVSERFGRVRIDKIDKVMVLAYAAELQTRERGRKLRGRTHGVDPRGHVNFIKAVLRAAVQVGVLPGMPALPRFAQSGTLPAAPAREHVERLLDGTDGWLRVAVALQAFAGLRQGEVRALEVGDIDFAVEVLHVRRAFSEQKLVVPKGNRQRTVPMLPELAEILRLAVADKLPRALVVTDRKGQPIRRQHFLRALKTAEKKLGLEQWWSHALRHYFCSALARGGANIEAVRALAGHRNVATTQRYVHATGGDLHAAIRKLRGN